MAHLVDLWYNAFVSDQQDERALWPTSKGTLQEMESGFEERLFVNPDRAFELVWILTKRSFQITDPEALERPFQRHSVRVIRDSK